jgi:hypothetical protein
MRFFVDWEGNPCYRKIRQDNLQSDLRSVGTSKEQQGAGRPLARPLVAVSQQKVTDSCGTWTYELISGIPESQLSGYVTWNLGYSQNGVDVPEWKRVPIRTGGKCMEAAEKLGIAGDNLRFLKIQNNRIDSIYGPDADLDKVKGLSDIPRLKIVPAPEGAFVRVVREGGMEPFLFTIIEGEECDQAKVRIRQMLNMNPEERVVLRCEPSRIIVEPEQVLSECCASGAVLVIEGGGRTGSRIVNAASQPSIPALMMLENQGRSEAIASSMRAKAPPLDGDESE